MTVWKADRLSRYLLGESRSNQHREVASSLPFSRLSDCVSLSLQHLEKLSSSIPQNSSCISVSIRHSSYPSRWHEWRSIDGGNNYHSFMENSYIREPRTQEWWIQHFGFSDKTDLNEKISQALKAIVSNLLEWFLTPNDELSKKVRFKTLIIEQAQREKHVRKYDRTRFLLSAEIQKILATYKL